MSIVKQHQPCMQRKDRKTNVRNLPITDHCPLCLYRFSRDVEVLDNTLPATFRMFLLTFFSTISSFIVITYSTPLFLVAMIPLAVLYYFIQVSYRNEKWILRWFFFTYITCTSYIEIGIILTSSCNKTYLSSETS